MPAEDFPRPLIFVSHVSGDGEVCRTLQDHLGKRLLGGAQFFNTSDDKTLRPGDTWFPRILEALQECSVLLAVLSPAGLASPWVNFEAGAAWIREAVVIPCCIGQVRKGALPAPYRDLQAVELGDAGDLALLVGRVASAVGIPMASTAELDLLASELREAYQIDEAGGDTDYSQWGNRIERHLLAEWRFDRSPLRDDAWSAQYRQEQRFEVLHDELNHVKVAFSPSIEAVPFGGDNRPEARLCAWDRSSPGAVVLGAPTQRTGSKFAFKVYFDPPLRKGDTAKLDLSVAFPIYRLGTRDALAAAVLKTGDPLRDYDFSSRTIQRAYERFTYRVMMPKALGATPLEPEVVREGVTYHEEEKLVRSDAQVFRVHEGDGARTWVMELDRRNPPFRTAYRLRWRLPRSEDVVPRGAC